VGDDWRGLSLEVIRSVCGIIACISEFILGFLCIFVGSDQGERVVWLVDGGTVGEIEARLG